MGNLRRSPWTEIRLSSGISPGRGPRLALARCWLYERITGFSGSRARWAIDSLDIAVGQSRCSVVGSRRSGVIEPAFRVGLAVRLDPPTGRAARPRQVASAEAAGSASQ